MLIAILAVELLIGATLIYLGNTNFFELPKWNDFVYILGIIMAIGSVISAIASFTKSTKRKYP